ncbi:MAG TPA: zf-HC2 domain-containing protein [Acidimicrobiales bacterium]|nr:zf-HC2 domain-containing protein [Acidimicrobiales bacterium]
MSQDRTVLGCEDVSELLPELALGTLAGRERADVLAHLEGCPSCSHEVEAMSQAADQLLLATPEAEPPVGFESRLFAELGTATGTGSRTRWFGTHMRTVTFAAAAAVAALAVGFGTGWAAAPSSTPQSPVAAPGGSTTAALTSATGVHGQVLTWQGWLLMTVHDLHVAGKVTCEVTTTSGRTVRVGSFWLSHGYGTWAAPLSVPADQVRTAQVVAWDGSVVAHATLRALTRRTRSGRALRPQ